LLNRALPKPRELEQLDKPPDGPAEAV